MMINSADLAMGPSTSAPPSPLGAGGYVEFSVLVPRNWAEILMAMSVSKHTSVGHLLREMIDQGLKGLEPVATTIE